MTKITNIEQRDTYINLEFSLNELMQLKDLLDHASIEYDSEKQPELKEASIWLENSFYPMLVEIENKISE